MYKNTPIYLNNALMPVYKFGLVFAFMLGFSSIFMGIGYAVYTYVQSDISLATSAYAGLLLFLKGAGITAAVSFISFLAIWKRHKIAYENCMHSRKGNCDEIGFFNFA